QRPPPALRRRRGGHRGRRARHSRGDARGSLPPLLAPRRLAQPEPQGRRPRPRHRPRRRPRPRRRHHPRPQRSRRPARPYPPARLITSGAGLWRSGAVDLSWTWTGGFRRIVMRKLAFLVPFAAAAALAAAAQAQPAGVAVTLDPAFAREAQKIGMRDVQAQMDRLGAVVERALADDADLAGARIELVLTDLRPNRP